MRLYVLIGLFLSCSVVGLALNLGATREQVIAELGKPTSTAARGDHELLLYPKNVRLELESGRVVSARGITLGEPTPSGAETSGAKDTDVTNAPAKVESPKVPKQAESPIAPLATATPSAAKPTAAKAAIESSGEAVAAAGPSTAPDVAQAIAKSQARLEKSVEAMVDRQERELRTPRRPSFDPVTFAVGIVLKILITVAALKLACKYWGCEIFWSGIIIVAVVDAAVRAAMTLLLIVLLGFPTLFYADEAVAALVMVLVLTKVSINSSTSQAVQLTLTTKTFTIVVGSFLVTFALRMLHP